MLIIFEPNVAKRSVASQNNHKSKACLPEASNIASTMYRCLKRRLRRLYKAPFLATFFLAPYSSRQYSFDWKTNPRNELGGETSVFKYDGRYAYTFYEEVLKNEFALEINETLAQTEESPFHSLFEHLGNLSKTF